MRVEASRVLAGNRQRGVSQWEGRAYDFVCPSPRSYPFQWLWDSGFHAIALLHVDAELAKQELRCLLQGQQPDGFLPHMLLWEKRFHAAALAEYSIQLAHEYFTATTQPPVLARSVERIVQATGDRAFAAEMLPPLQRLFRWWAGARDPDEDGLVAILQPDESGLDASPKYDVYLGLQNTPPGGMDAALKAAMQRLFAAYRAQRTDARALMALDVFTWKDVLVNTIYADGLRCLARLERLLGGRGDEWDRQAERTESALLEKCWDPAAGAFWDLHGAAETPVRVLTVTSLLPLALESLPSPIATRLVEEHLLNPREFWLPYPVPSVAASEPSFAPTFDCGAIWRGPTWVNTNWYLYHGLRAHGFADIATDLARRTVEMVARGGIREFFNPYTAEGYGAPDFGWTTLVLDVIHAEGWGCGCSMEHTRT